jgi:hypothetical protein
MGYQRRGRSTRRFHLGVLTALFATAAAFAGPARAESEEEKALPNLVYTGCHGTFHLLGAAGTAHYTWKCETYLVKLTYWTQSPAYYY